jgi:cobalt-zinc-cadmium efflux system membrane fusion protein
MNTKQKLSIAAILFVTVLLGALILVTHPGQAGSEDAAPEAEHADKEAPQHQEAATQESGNNIIAINDAQAKDAGIVLATAGSASIASTIRLPTEIRLNQDRTSHIVPRVTGVVESVSADLGQKVKKGQVLAVLNSALVSDLRSDWLNAQQRLALARTSYQREKELWEEKISAQQDFLQAQQALQEAQIAARNARQKLTAIGAGADASVLNRFELRAPFDGVVVEKHLAVGEAVREDANVFTVSDLSTVWAELIVPAHQLNVVRVGEKVRVRTTAFASEATGTISYVGALLGEQTRSATARIVLPNPDGVWRPGLFADAEIGSGEAQVPLAVAAEAVQTVEGKSMVYVKTAGGFKPTLAKTARQDHAHIEIVDGLKPGDVYAAVGSFVLKAEQGKGSAEHEH